MVSTCMQLARVGCNSAAPSAFQSGVFTCFLRSVPSPVQGTSHLMRELISMHSACTQHAIRKDEGTHQQALSQDPVEACNQAVQCMHAHRTRSGRSASHRGAATSAHRAT